MAHACKFRAGTLVKIAPASLNDRPTGTICILIGDHFDNRGFGAATTPANVCNGSSHLVISEVGLEYVSGLRLARDVNEDR